MTDESSATPDDAYASMLSYLRRMNPPLPAWCVGVAADLDDRFYGEHGHRLPLNYWSTSLRCKTNQDAVTAAQRLVQDGCENGGIEHGETSVFLYVYLKAKGATVP